MNHSDDSSSGHQAPHDSGLADPDNRADLKRMAADHAEIIGSPQRRSFSPRSLMSLQFGSKAEIEERMHDLSVGSRHARQDIPYGTVAPGGGRLIAAALAVIVIGAAALLALLYWLVS